MCMKPVLSLLEYYALRSVDNILGYLVSAVSREAVKEDSVLMSSVHDVAVYLIILEDLNAHCLFFFLAHACPCIGIDNVSILGSLERISSHKDLGTCDLSVCKSLLNVLVGACVILRRCDSYIHTCLCASLKQRVSYVVTVA